ncbi:uracil-DNA glycosylase [Buchnera aphidicola]|uniref:uracil-DNA glycosylase n=1 Tax=Buchnera aphidicola TaxID=9 RepID=UPI00346408C8
MIFNWKDLFYKEKNKLFKILHRVNKKRLSTMIFPSKENVFNAFYYTPFHKIKIVIIGQDPYHQRNQANGLSFSVNYNCKIPPSLKNIYKEIINDLLLPKNYYDHGCLYHWAHQGVLLLNSILTVELGKPKSHILYGWSDFTDAIIYYISKYLDNIIFVLWGKYAQQKSYIINHNRHYVLCAAHPSPYSANLGFFGCRHFSEINKILLLHNKIPIFW